MRTEERPVWTAEQEGRDMLDRMGVPRAQRFSAGELVELANVIAATRAFTREDVAHLRFMAERERSADEVGEMGAHAEYGDELDRIADRIEALLPTDGVVVGE